MFIGGDLTGQSEGSCALSDSKENREHKVCFALLFKVGIAIGNKLIRILNM